ncbi:MAG: CdaR family protein [Myxococcales bacterium]|nr:CdaR family protein [Myxococcales bacterium]
MARRGPSLRLLALAIVLALVLWSMAHGTASTEESFDIPIVFRDVPDKIVITDQSTDEVNVRVLGTRAALRNIKVSKLVYQVEVSGAKPGPAVYEVDISSQLDLPRGAKIVSRSPSQIKLRFERRGRKAVRVRPDLEGEPAEGFVVTGVEVDPPRVWLVGARSTVLRLSEVVTETVDVTGLAESTERAVKLSLGGSHVWMEDKKPVTLRIAVEAVPEAGDEPAA